MSLYEKFKEYQVNDVKTVEEFIDKYYKHERINHKETLINNYKEELNKYGYTFISHHDNITGKVVSFYK